MVAQKLEITLRLRTLNSRMKDYWDVWQLSRQFAFEGPVLVEAVRATLGRRGTPAVAHPVALAEGMAKEPGKESQWRAFLSRTRQPE